MISLWIGNLGKYNEGELVGDWFELPIDDIEEALKSIGVSNEPDENGVYYEECFIGDYDTDIDGLNIERYQDIETLNELAETIETAERKKELDCFLAILEEYTHDLQSAISTYNNGSYIFLGDISPADYGRECFYNKHCGINKSLERDIEYYFDFEEFGKDELQDFFNSNHGYILIQ